MTNQASIKSISKAVLQEKAKVPVGLFRGVLIVLVGFTMWRVPAATEQQAINAMMQIKSAHGGQVDVGSMPSVIINTHDADGVARIVTDSHGDIADCNMPALSLFEEEVMPSVVGHNIVEWMRPMVSQRHVSELHSAIRQNRNVQEKLECDLIVNGKAKHVHFKVNNHASGNLIYAATVEESSK